MIARMNTQHDSNATDPSPPSPEVVTAAEAARRTKRGRATIQRYLEARRFPGAVKGPQGWQIPLQDLIDAGLALTGPQMEMKSQLRRSRMPNDIDALKTELTITRDKLDAESTARRSAEQLAEERAQHIRDLRGLVDVILAGSAGRGEPTRA